MPLEDLENLAPRERAVLALLADGKRRAAIAEELCVSAHTVDTHVKRIYKKLGVHSVVEASYLYWEAVSNGDEAPK